MERYKNYKDSGFDRIGEIPEHWEVKKIKYLIEDHSGNGFPNVEQGKKGLEYPFYKVSDINKNSMFVDKANNYVSLETIEENKWNIIPKHSVIAAKIGEALRKNHRKITKIDCLIDNNCIGLEPNGIDYKFNFYFQSLIDFDWFVNPGAVPSLSVEKYKQFKVAIPKNIKEQTAIANYLDRKTAEIDELINQKEQLLKLYEEEKTAIINQAVTKGIIPNVKMKDSDIVWLGEIPEHWEVKRVATFGSFSKGKGIPRSELKDDGFSGILYGDIYTKYNIKAEIIKNHISEETTKTSVEILKGDLLFTGSGETVEDIGKCIAYVGNETIYAGGDVIILRQKKHNSLFLSYSLSSNASIYQKASMAKGQIIIHIYASNLREIILPIPPLEEQTAIVQHIETEINRINTKAEKTKKLIDLLGEYKQSLISEVVTGKIKVI